MLVGIIILILGLALIIFDGLSAPKWRLLGTIWAWLNNRIIRRILRILLVLAIIVGGLFLIATIGFLGQSKHPNNTGLMWVTLLPIIAAMLVIWICLISAGALESVARGIARLLGFQISGQSNLVKSWEKGFLSAAFWIYLILAFYPFWNPWTGKLHPTLIVGLLFGGMALATYARWAAGAGKKSKIFGLIIVPLIFVFLLGAKYPKEFPTIGSLVGWQGSQSNKSNAKRDMYSAARNQQAEFYREGEEIIKNNTYALLKSNVVALDENLNQIVLEEGYKEEAKILQKLAVTDLPPKLKALFVGSTERFYKLQFMDDLGKYTIRSKIGYIETSSIKGIINIPEAPEIKKSSSFRQEFEARLSDGNYVKFDPRPALELNEGMLVGISGPREYKWGFDIKENATMPISITALAPRGAETIYIRGPRVPRGDSKKFKITIGGD